MDVASNLAEIEAQVDRACRSAGRQREDVKLLAVSKTVEATRIRQAYDAGQRAFGESRQQEAEAKVGELPGDVEWHFIGNLQRNKVRKVLSQFRVIHSVDSLRLAGHIDRIAGEMGVKPEIFLEVNIAGEASKGGFAVDEIREAAGEIAALPNLALRGLMAIPPDEEDAEKATRWFREIRRLRDDLQERHGIHLPDLSMGMSGDFEAAIHEGSTIVRVGSAIFGERSDPTHS